jgi:hypothetical protein
MIFAARGLLCETHEIRTGDMVMVAYPAPPHPGGSSFRIICVGLSLVAEAVGFLMIYPVRGVASVKRVPGSGFVGVKRVLRHDPLPDEGECVGLVTGHGG